MWSKVERSLFRTPLYVTPESYRQSLLPFLSPTCPSQSTLLAHPASNLAPAPLICRRLSGLYDVRPVSGSPRRHASLTLILQPPLRSLACKKRSCVDYDLTPLCANLRVCRVILPREPHQPTQPKLTFSALPSPSFTLLNVILHPWHYIGSCTSRTIVSAAEATDPPLVT